MRRSPIFSPNKSLAADFFGSQDPFLQRLANAGDLAIVSVGYRLAPEHPFPLGPEDCYDAADWLVDNSQARFRAPLMFAGGEVCSIILGLT